LNNFDVVHWLLGGLTTLFGGIGVYLKARMKELDTLREENTILKVKVARLEERILHTAKQRIKD
tara:strand:+ start:1639 stop:1830 length:192 start_codon:yes stop_codon:yes gene_type:complete